MNITLALAAAATLAGAIGQPSDALKFQRGDIARVEDVPGLYYVAPLLKRSGNAATLVIVIPNAGKVGLVAFDCVRHLFAITGEGAIDQDGDGYVVNDIEPPGNPHSREMTAVSESPWGPAAEKTACGNPA